MRGTKKYNIFPNSQTQPILEPEMMKTPGVGGIAVAVNHARPPCLTTAIPINPNDKDFSKLCIAAQLFSMAQKWVCIFNPFAFLKLLDKILDVYQADTQTKVLEKVLNTSISYH